MWRASLLAAVTLSLLTSCGGHPWWYRGGESACGTPVMMRVAGHVEGVGDCAANLSIPPTSVTLAVGQRLDLRVVVDESSTPIIALPVPTDTHVLRLIKRSRDSAGATYEALATGSADLVSSRASCVDRASHKQTRGSCVVVRVTVR